MLILARHLQQRVRLTIPPSTTETTIEVCLVNTRGDSAALGFEAPNEVAIMRTELLTAGHAADSATDGGPDIGG